MIKADLFVSFFIAASVKKINAGLQPAFIC